MRFRIATSHLPSRPCPVPAYPWIPLLFVLVGGFFLVFIALGDPRNAGFGLVVIAAGVIPYVYRRRSVNRHHAVRVSLS